MALPGARLPQRGLSTGDLAAPFLKVGQVLGYGAFAPCRLVVTNGPVLLAKVAVMQYAQGESPRTFANAYS